jgi:hypothetical protein
MGVGDMQKIISLFKRDYVGNRLVYDEVVEGAEWIIAGEGVATEKFDGTSCMIQDGQLYKRYDRKLTDEANKRIKQLENVALTIDDFKPAPDGWIAAMDKPDIHTGHYTGWLPVDFSKPENQWHKQGYIWLDNTILVIDGTYELVGEKVQGNPYGLEGHELWVHGKAFLYDAPRDYAGLKAYLSKTNIEGIVWHHPDGRMVKLKAKDFGIAWGKK